MLSVTERMLKVATANPAVLARVDAVLCGVDTTTAQPETDCRVITKSEAAQRLRVSRPTLDRLIACGRIETVALCGVRRVKLSSVVELFEGNREIDRAANDTAVAIGRARFEKGNRTKIEKGNRNKNGKGVAQ